MRVSNNRSTMRWRYGVALTGLLNGLFVLLMLAAVSCGGTQPDDAVETASPVAPLTLVPTLANFAPPEQTELPADGTWILELLDGRPIIEGSFVMVEIDEYQVGGFDGCNWYGGRFEDGTLVADESGVFSFPPSGSTQRLCEEPLGVMEQASAFLSVFGVVETYRVAGQKLEVIGSVGDVRLVFVKQMPLAGRASDLEGTAWRIVKEDVHAKGDVNAATMAFLDDRLVIGDTACRPYLATYISSEAEVRFPSQSMLERSVWQSCSDEERRLEGEFGDFLSSANEYAVQEERGSSWLRMRSTTGKMMTFEQLPPIVEDVADAEWILLALTELRQLELGMWHHRTDNAVEVVELTLSFHGDGISGSTGCNSYGAEARVEDGVFTLNTETFFYTEIGCDDTDGVMEQEKRYLDILPDVTRYGVYGDHLILQTNDDVFLLFRAE